MEQARGKRSSRNGKLQRALANKGAAGSRARALVQIIHEPLAAGFLSRRSLADELNRRGIPTARGGRWHYTTVVRTLTRLGLIRVGKGRSNQRLAVKKAADARAGALASTIRKLRKAGFVSLGDIARELDKRHVPTARGGKWHRKSVSRLLQRLEKLETARRRRGRSSSRHRR
jgi:hypothetical protein